MIPKSFSSPSSARSTDAGAWSRRALLGGLAFGAGLASLAAQERGAADDEAYWLRVRELFPLDPNVIQLNHAAIGSPPERVLAAARRYEAQLAAQPSHAYYDEQEALGERVRAQLADFFACSADEIALTRNASESLDNVIFGLDLARGDEVLTTTQDYPAMLDALRQRADREGIVLKLQRIPAPPQSPDELFAAFTAGVTPRTRAILVSHMTYATGLLFPVRRICEWARARGIFSIVDGAQSFGHVPVGRDDLGCDAFGASLHKYFCAPVGTGFLYLRRDRIPQVWPLMAAEPALRNDIRKFDGLGPGTMPLHLRNAIPQAIAFNRILGIEHKAARLRYLRRRWSAKLAQIPGVRLLTPDADTMSCGTATFVPARWDAARFVAELEKRHQVQTRVRSVAGEFTGVRVSPNVYTTADEIDRFVDAATALLTRGDKA